MSYVWEGKQERVHAARKHTKEMAQTHSEEIAKSVDGSIIYDDFRKYRNNNTKFIDPITVTVVPTDTVSAVLSNPGRKLAVLNFASYKHPGGMFLQGSRAQEECLCHESNLFNVLKQFKKQYYNENAKHSNYNLYGNEILYSPDILFERNGVALYADVITSAAPNLKAFYKYSNKQYDMGYINNMIKSRMRCIFNSAWANEVDTIILGAWGCGVFGNSPENIAKLFHEVMKEYFHDFCSIRHYIFAIPYDQNTQDPVAKYNFESFNNEFKTFMIV